MKQLESGRYFHYIFRNSIQTVISGTYVDDLIWAGDSEFKTLSRITPSVGFISNICSMNKC